MVWQRRRYSSCRRLRCRVSNPHSPESFATKTCRSYVASSKKEGYRQGFWGLQHGWGCGGENGEDLRRNCCGVGRIGTMPDTFPSSLRRKTTAGGMGGGSGGSKLAGRRACSGYVDEENERATQFGMRPATENAASKEAIHLAHGHALVPQDVGDLLGLQELQPRVGANRNDAYGMQALGEGFFIGAGAARFPRPLCMFWACASFIKSLTHQKCTRRQGPQWRNWRA